MWLGKNCCRKPKCSISFKVVKIDEDNFFQSEVWLKKKSTEVKKEERKYSLRLIKTTKNPSNRMRQALAYNLRKMGN